MMTIRIALHPSKNNIDDTLLFCFRLLLESGVDIVGLLDVDFIIISMYHVTTCFCLVLCLRKIVVRGFGLFGIFVLGLWSPF